MQTSSTSGLAIIRRIRINEAWIPLRDCRGYARWRAARIGRLSASWVRYPPGFSVPGQGSIAFARTAPTLLSSRRPVCLGVLDIRMVQGNTRASSDRYTLQCCAAHTVTHTIFVSSLRSFTDDIDSPLRSYENSSSRNHLIVRLRDRSSSLCFWWRLG